MALHTRHQISKWISAPFLPFYFLFDLLLLLLILHLLLMLIWILNFVRFALDQVFPTNYSFSLLSSFIWFDFQGKKSNLNFVSSSFFQNKQKENT